MGGGHCAAMWWRSSEAARGSRGLDKIVSGAVFVVLGLQQLSEIG